MPRINGERLLADLRRIADFGRYQTGVHRPHLSPQDVESRHWLAGRMKEAGLEPVIDGVGNVIGRSPKTGPRLLMGSHSDTQPPRGWVSVCEPIRMRGPVFGLLPSTVPTPSITGSSPASFMRSISQCRLSTSCGDKCGRCTPVW